ncbi:MAG: HAMP domain-containing histidine kinase [Porphyromonadaceae bacterium]|nr:HAMP domain-containing histidine kinase [Porphyromonadaceae bacterium]
MKKSTIWLLAIIMALTFSSLLYIQIKYIENMVKMRNEQFSEAVKRSLYAVSSQLEQDETKRYLAEDIEENQKRLLSIEAGNVSASKQWSGTSLDATFSFNTQAGSFNAQDHILPFSKKSTASNANRGSSITSTYRDMQEILKNQYLYQKGLLENVILNILSTARNRPILERIDTGTLTNYLKAEFKNNGLTIPFQFAIYDPKNKIVYATSEYNPKERGTKYSINLFPNDPMKRQNQLMVYFPTKKDYIYSSVQFGFPSFSFTLILLITFIFTIFKLFRQKKLTEMKNDFINNMTHEFKTPISTISLAAQMLKDSSVEKSPEMLQHISTVINDETKRLRFQVEKVLQMSMFEHQKTMMKLTVLDVNTLITEVLGTFKLKVERFGGTIEADLTPDDAYVEVDKMHFTNVIFNLLDNAIKYAREDVPLQLHVRTRVDGNKVVVAIQDNGIGIKKEYLKKIFERFYRVSTGNVHNVKGFGLGLAYVHKIVTDLKGTIRAESELNIGTTFIITLPLKNE